MDIIAVPNQIIRGESEKKRKKENKKEREKQKEERERDFNMVKRILEM